MVVVVAMDVGAVAAGAVDVGAMPVTVVVEGEVLKAVVVGAVVVGGIACAGVGAGAVRVGVGRKAVVCAPSSDRCSVEGTDEVGGRAELGAGTAVAVGRGNVAVAGIPEGVESAGSDFPKSSA